MEKGMDELMKELLKRKGDLHECELTGGQSGEGEVETVQATIAYVGEHIKTEVVGHCSRTSARALMLSMMKTFDISAVDLFMDKMQQDMAKDKEEDKKCQSN